LLRGNKFDLQADAQDCACIGNHEKLIVQKFVGIYAVFLLAQRIYNDRYGQLS